MRNSPHGTGNMYHIIPAQIQYEFCISFLYSWIVDILDLNQPFKMKLTWGLQSRTLTISNSTIIPAVKGPSSHRYTCLLHFISHFPHCQVALADISGDKVVPPYGEPLHFFLFNGISSHFLFGITEHYIWGACSVDSSISKKSINKCFGPMLVWYIVYGCMHGTVQGELTVSYGWTGWNNRLKSETAGELPIVLEESVEYSSDEWKQNWKMSTCDRLDLESLASNPDDKLIPLVS